MKHVLRSRGDRRRCQCLSDIMSGGVLDREGKEHTEDVDSYATPSGAIVLVLKVQAGVFAGQLFVR